MVLDTTKSTAAMLGFSMQKGTVTTEVFNKSFKHSFLNQNIQQKMHMKNCLDTFVT